MSNGSLKVKAKKISNIVLIILLILGILTSGFGVSVVAFASVYSEPERSVNAQTPSTENNTEKTETEYFDPNKEYIDVKNEAALKDDVVVLSDTQSDAFNSSNDNQPFPSFTASSASCNFINNFFSALSLS